MYIYNIRKRTSELLVLFLCYRFHFEGFRKYPGLRERDISREEISNEGEGLISSGVQRLKRYPDVSFRMVIL
jgi:hypothetical protein